MTASKARVLVVDDDPGIRMVVRDRLRKLGYETRLAEDGSDGLAQIDAWEPDLVLLDLRMPKLDGFGVLEQLNERARRPDVVVITAHGSVEAAVKAMQMGAADFVSKPFDQAHLEHVVRRSLQARSLQRRVASLEHELSAHHTLVMGESSAMRKAVDIARRAAASDATVLLLGPSGSGKEVLARFVHAESERAGRAFVALNCATLSGELIASELFGHERGAFTGAVAQKAGKIEQAAGGTLFLDEIGELSAELQAKLLRVLQEREYERLGGTRTLHADVRVVAATHRDLGQAIEEGRFREDLYYRLNVVSIAVPPLRDRLEDLPALAEHFLQRHAAKACRPGIRLSEQALAALLEYDWPGNVRELSNVIERAVVLAQDDELGVSDLAEDIRDHAAAPSRRGAQLSGEPAALLEPEQGFHDAVSEAKRRIIAEALEETGRHQTRAAQRLGLSQPSLARLMKNLGMSMPKRKSG